MTSISEPIVFDPIFQERIWGGRKLAQLYRKNLPADKRIGEAWEIVDRPEAQSIVANGPLKGKTLHQLWTNHRHEIFGDLKTTRQASARQRLDQPAEPDRFPVLIKLLDAREKLSLQVHPPAHVADKLGGEPKTECWYVAHAEADAELFVGFSKPTTRDEFAHSIKNGTLADCLHSIPVKPGDAMFLPSGRFHAIGAGNVLVEIQENSDTTYRVFDWNRVDDSGRPRQLHVDQALQCIDYGDLTPKLAIQKGESVVHHELFHVDKWKLDQPREAAALGQFAIICCLTGKLECAGVELMPAHFFFIPASLKDRQLHPRAEATTLLRITIPL